MVDLLPSARTYIVGDVHGHFAKLVPLLHGAGLVDDALRWSGGTARLWFMGDFFDRGPDGIGVIDLVMRLQDEAAGVGGMVGAVLGNHEPLLLAARRFGSAKVDGLDETVHGIWLANGGQPRDMERLTEQHIRWLTQLPAMVHLDDRLLVHADAMFYLNYGQAIETVNQAIERVLQGADLAAWDRLLDEFSERNSFGRKYEDGAERATRFLQIFGGRQLIHGHTPLPYLLRQPPEQIAEPLVYAEGLCVNVDGGMGMGGPGFVVDLATL